MPAAFGQANLKWTTSSSSLTEGAGTWNQGVASLPSGAPWHNGSSYGNIMNSGDTVTFGGGTAGTGATVNNGTTLAPAKVVFLTPFSTATYYTIGTNGFNAGGTASLPNNPISLAGGVMTNASAGGATISCPVNGSFTYYSSASKVNFNGDGNQTGADTINLQLGTLQIGGNAGQRGSFGAAKIINNGQVIWRRGSLAAGYSVSNAISGSGSVQYQLNTATFIILSNQTYAGSTIMTPSGSASGNNSVLKLGASDVLPTNTDFAINQTAGTLSTSTLDLNGKNQTLGSLASDANATLTATKVTGGSTCTLTLAGTSKLKFYNGDITGGMSLALTGAGSKLTLSNACTYTGNTTISAGTLALGPGGSINGSAQIAIGTGGTFDVSAIPAYTLSGSSAFKASGTSSPATLKGGITVSLGSQSVILNYDGTNPALTVSQGQLVLNGNLFTVNGPALVPGDYLIITNIGSTVSSSGSYSVNGSALFGTLGSIVVSGGAVTLHVVTADVSIANSSVTASPDNLPADNSSTSTVTATIRDSSNNPIVGLGVNWSVSGSANTVSPAASGVTDGSGQVSFTVRSAKAETKLVTVTVGANTVTNSMAIFFTAGSGNAFVWDPGHTPGTGSNGDGAWDASTANWANGGADFPWPNNGNDTVRFGLNAALAASCTVALNSPATVGNMNFSYTGGNQYSIVGTNTLTLAGTPTITSAGYALINCSLEGTGFNAQLNGAGSALRIQSDNTNYTGDVTVNGGGTLQLGFNSASGSLGSGTITLNDPASLVVRRATGTMVLSNLIAGSTSFGSVGFQLNGGIVVTLARANTYAATTYQQPTGSGNNSGTIQLGVNNSLPANTDFTIKNNNSPGSVQTFDLAGFNQTLHSLSTDAYASTANVIITNSTSAAGTLAVAGAGVATTFGGRIAGKVNLTLEGAGGTLTVQQTNSLSDLSIVTITNGAALDLAFTGTNQVAGLVVDGVSKSAGVYSAGTDSPYLAGTGYLLVQPVAPFNPNPTNLAFSVVGSTLHLAWPPDYLGWCVQSNAVALGSTSDWFAVPGSETVTNLAITIDQAKGNVFYRMRKP
ncbi:MAG: Ig-like domain-containing protein [Verrucomicrobiota bacterium]